jgi:hypothetical protein
MMPFSPVYCNTNTKYRLKVEASSRVVVEVKGCQRGYTYLTAFIEKLRTKVYKLRVIATSHHGERVTSGTLFIFA